MKELKIVMCGEKVDLYGRTYSECGEQLLTEKRLDFDQVRLFFDYGITRVFHSPLEVWREFQPLRTFPPSAIFEPLTIELKVDVSKLIQSLGIMTGRD